ncbi:MAG TPA: histidine kinase, partial [Longimicrobiaceae bacterium]
MNEQRAPRGSRLWWLAVGAWFVYDLLDTLEGVPPGAPAWLVAAGVLGSALVSASFLVVPVLLARRWGGERFSRGVGVHLAAGLALAGADALRMRLLAGGLGVEAEPHPFARFFLVLLGYGLFTGVAHAVEYARRLRQKEVSELRLRAELSEVELRRTQAELRALKMELNPHFLFNSLHAIG